MYDIIGDIHGQVDELRGLLKKLGYMEVAGAYRHPERTAIFLGDFIDRGPGSLEVIDIVRRMVDAGQAQAVMGNHEFNALAYHTEHPARPGEYLRPRSEKNRKQHQATLDALADRTPDDMLAWFYTLPLWLDLGSVRVVHAFWDEASMETLVRTGAVDEARRLRPESLHAASTRGDGIYHAVERVLKGLEVDLPGGLTYEDKEGNVRSEIRVTWWDAARKSTWRELALGPRSLSERLPAGAGPEPRLSAEYPLDAAPVFVGHYWLTGAPAPLAPNVACVDYSVAKQGGALAAYRWSGERVLHAENFVSVPRHAGPAKG